MKISFNTSKEVRADIKDNHGFGYAAIGMLNALEHLNYKVEFNDPTADVGIVFGHPSQARFYPHQYNILFFPWESTEVHPGWLNVMDAVNEIWAPTPWVAGVFMRLTNTPVYVYEHGVEHTWRPKRRKVTDRLMFLHQGAEAARKNGWDVVNAFRRAFPHQDDVGLTLKMINPNFVWMPKNFGRVNYMNESIKLFELQALYASHHVYVYPSAGEGFGLTPLQAMATGMPTITVGEWAPYIDLLDPKLTLSSKYVATQWPDIHPGKLLRYSIDELVEQMKYSYYYFDELAQEAFDRAAEVHKRYDWNSLTAKTFGDLEHRLTERKNIKTRGLSTTAML